MSGQAGHKSVGLALVAEWLVPGVGAMYAGSVGIGIGWLVGTAVWGFISGVLLFIALGGGVYYILNSFGADHLPVVMFSLIITTLVLGWLVVRLLVVRGMTRRYNQRVAAGNSAQVPEQPGETNNLFTGGHAASSAALASVIPVLIPLLQFVNILTWVDQYLLIAALMGVASLLPIAFLTALIRLPQVPWWRAVIETLATLAVTQLVVVVGSFVAFLLRPGIQFADLLQLLPPVLVVVYWHLLPVLIASGFGFAAAWLFAPWSAVRERGHGSSNSLWLAALAIILGIAFQLARSVALSRISYEGLPYTVISSDVFVLLLAIGTILAASLMTRAQLRHSQVNLTHA